MRPANPIASAISPPGHPAAHVPTTIAGRIAGAHARSVIGSSTLATNRATAAAATGTVARPHHVMPRSYGLVGRVGRVGPTRPTRPTVDRQTHQAYNPDRRMKTAKVLAINRDQVPTMLDHMATLSDAIRCRMVLALERHELTVSELCSVLQLPQSTVSRHLKTLGDDGWLTSRRDGTSRYYSMSIDDLDAGARRLWPLIREQVSATSAADHDERRLKGVLTRRRSKSEEFFSSASGRWDHLREELFGD